jgi:hypothetical protein
MTVLGTNRTSPFSRPRSAFRAEAEIADSGNQPLLITPSNRTETSPSDPKLDSEPFYQYGFGNLRAFNQLCAQFTA